MSEDLDPDDDAPPEQPATDAGSRKQHRKRVDKARMAERRAFKFWEDVWGDPVGRREMWLILQACHTFEPEFACGPNGMPQSEATFYKLGEQLLGQRLYQTWLCRHQTGIALMHAENDPRFVRIKPPGDEP